MNNLRETIPLCEQNRYRKLTDFLIYERIIVVFVCFSRIYLLGIVIFKGLTARRLYKSLGFKGLILNRIIMIQQDENSAKNQVNSVIT
jgi:hypothetical protein